MNVLSRELKWLVTWWILGNFKRYIFLKGKVLKYLFVSRTHKSNPFCVLRTQVKMTSLKQDYFTIPFSLNYLTLDHQFCLSGRCRGGYCRLFLTQRFGKQKSHLFDGVVFNYQVNCQSILQIIVINKCIFFPSKITQEI